MTAAQILFYLFGAIVLGSALLVVTLKNLVRSIFLFFVTLFAMAGLYVFALADFIAVTQVIIYVGGVLVLMLFAFMLSDKELLSNLQAVKTGFKLHHFLGILVSLCLFFILINVVLPFDEQNISWLHQANDNQIIQASDNTVNQIGIHTMTRYLLPFEIVSVFLMMALIGAAHLARKEKNA